MQTLMAGNFIISTFMSFSLNYLWGMINCIQLIVYLPLYNIIFPANINMFLTVLINIATFDVIPMIDDINEALFDFEHLDDAIGRDSLGWDALDFETKNFTTNSGSLFFIVLLFIIQKIAMVFVKILAKRYATMTFYYRKWKAQIDIRQVISRFIIEGYIELFLCSLLCLELSTKIDVIYTNFSDGLSFTLSTVFLILILMLPIVIVHVIGKKIDYLETAALVDDVVILKPLRKQERAFD